MNTEDLGKVSAGVPGLRALSCFLPVAVNRLPQYTSDLFIVSLFPLLMYWGFFSKSLSVA